MITQEIDLSLTDNLVPTVVHAKQYDHLGRVIQCSLYKEDVRYTIQEDTIVNVTGTRPDGQVFQYSTETANDIISVEDNTVCICVTNAMTGVSGKTPVDVSLISSDSEILGAFCFILHVEKAALRNNSLSTGSYSSTVQNVANAISDVYISDEGYVTIESDDALGLTYSIDDNGVLSVDYNN